MIKIRRNVFESNSSSCHSIAISKEPVTIVGGLIRFHLGEYGWENDCVNPADYLYTAIMYGYNKEWADKKLERLKEMLDAHSIEYTFEEPVWYEGSSGTWLDNGYIDHCYELDKFVDAVLSDDDRLMRLLFGRDSAVYTGNDNSDDRYGMCYVADTEIYDHYDEDEKKWVIVPHPYHDETKFEYFFKGN